jgi:hypothetical protein
MEAVRAGLGAPGQRDEADLVALAVQADLT